MWPRAPEKGRGVFQGLERQRWPLDQIKDLGFEPKLMGLAETWSVPKASDWPIWGERMERGSIIVQRAVGRLLWSCQPEKGSRANVPNMHAGWRVLMERNQENQFVQMLLQHLGSATPSRKIWGLHTGKWKMELMRWETWRCSVICKVQFEEAQAERECSFHVCVLTRGEQRPWSELNREPPLTFERSLNLQKTLSLKGVRSWKCMSVIEGK